MTDPKRLVDQCVHKGLLYLAESLQYYWPANRYGKTPLLNEVAENNIALHLARSFAAKGFLMWAEVPFEGVNKRLDFFAYHDKDKLGVALELKTSIDKPPSGSRDDLERLIKIANSNLANADAVNVEGAKWLYGIVSVLYASALVDWWQNPEGCDDYLPKGYRAASYKQIGMALTKAYTHKVVPLRDWGDSCTHAAYALYDENSINVLKMC